jgi:hypothetical protein
MQAKFGEDLETPAHRAGREGSLDAVPVGLKHRTGSTAGGGNR